MPTIRALSFALAGLLLSHAADAEPRFSPERFFAGRTEGRGEIRVLLFRRHGFQVEGRGVLQKDGTLLLRQVLDEEGKPPARREWRLKRTGENSFRGTLSDAEGPVEGELSGSLLQLRYTLQGGYRVRQSLQLEPDGTTIRNRLTVYKFGLPVAGVSETIRKLR